MFDYRPINKNFNNLQSEEEEKEKYIMNMGLGWM